MKIKDGFVVRDVAGDTVVLPTGDLDINAMITLNETAAFMWRAMEQEISEEDLQKLVMEKYEVDADTAANAVNVFVSQLKENDFLA